ncbi:MAG: transglycosylase family protein [Acidimicrobiia bacterium]|nr:transglycosylase family protein [Acidimicrobiia bacterium]
MASNHDDHDDEYYVDEPRPLRRRHNRQRPGLPLRRHRHLRLPAGASGTLACIRRIESGGNYGAVNSTGRFRGAYQFDRTTWNSVAARHNPAYVGVDPAAAPAAVQDQLAAALISERGLSPWPTPNRRCR